MATTCRESEPGLLFLHFPLSLRYGTEKHGAWSPWRETSGETGEGQEVNTRAPQRVELGRRTHFSGYSSVISSWLFSLTVRNLDDGTEQVFGKHSPKACRFASLRESPMLMDSELILTHLSGHESIDKANHKYAKSNNVFSIIFHFK